MKISIFGLGYVGCVSAACFAQAGHEVVGVDVSDVKVEIINQGKSPIVEPGIADLLSSSVTSGQLRATTDTAQAIKDTDVSFVCVGTPSQSNGSLDLSYVRRVCEQIGSALATKESSHIVVVRSTMLPGTIAETVIPALEKTSGKQAGKEFSVAINPEFLREGTALKDFYRPPFTLVGADDDATAETLRALYTNVDAPFLITRVREAEMVKYACNCFHAVKVAFANEVGNLCQSLGVDSHRVMEVFCQDTKLNLSPYYLKPGFAFGGSCLPKDLRAVTHKAKSLDIELPLLNSILPSNRLQVERAVEGVLRSGLKKVGVLGLSFKSGTDDLRESPMVTLIETLIGKGLHLLIYDREVELARLFGANKNYIEREIPHISSLMRSSLDEVIQGSDVIIVGKKEEEFIRPIEEYASESLILDLVRLPIDMNRVHRYQGICW